MRWKKAVLVLPFIHVAHFAYLLVLLVVKVQCREASGVVGSRGCCFPGQTRWIPVAGVEPGGVELRGVSWSFLHWPRDSRLTGLASASVLQALA